MGLHYQSIVAQLTQGLRYVQSEYKKDSRLGFDTVFPGELILDCLNSVKEPMIRPMTQAMARALLKQRSPAWSFNYWYKDSQKYKGEPYPDDWDDTSCALGAIQKTLPMVISGTALAAVVNGLTLCEEREGGPYRTWLVATDTRKQWSDVDVAVNANIAYFLALQEVELEPLTQFVEARIKANTLTSPYYQGTLPVLYFISRWYRGKLVEQLAQMILAEMGNGHQLRSCSALDVSLALTSLVRLGLVERIPDPWIQQLVGQQQSNGAWPAADLYFYRDKTQKTDYIGSAVLTTAFAVEALTLYSQAIQTFEKKQAFREKTHHYTAQVQAQTLGRLAIMPANLRKPATKLLSTLFAKDTDGLIVLTPWFLQQALESKLQAQVSTAFMTTLSTIMVLGWGAYTVYDHVWDEEAGLDQIPLANALCREMDILFATLPVDSATGFAAFYRQTMHGLEAANYWELTHCRFGYPQPPKKIPAFESYLFLAERSLGHALPGIALLCVLGLNVSSVQAKALWQFFRCFLSARQMNDDAHDWWADLTHGQINSVGALVLKQWQGSTAKQSQNLKGMKSKLEQLFWLEVVPDYCQAMQKLLKKARYNLKKYSILEQPEPLEAMIAKIEASVDLVLAERQKTIEFVGEYYGKVSSS